MTDNSIKRPLEGIRVIDYSHFLAGPYLSRCLAALGAEVIKVERPGSGDAGRAHPYFIEGQSGYFMQQNMDKQGLCINVKEPEGLALMYELIKTADVFVENYRPGALAKLGLGYEELKEINPKLVYCSVSAYGHTGPDSHRAGFGLIAEAKSGIMAMVGNPGETPPLLRIALGDMYTGIHGVAAINAALLGRTHTGKGQHIDMALYDTLVSMHEYAVQCYTLSGGEEIPEKTGQDLPTSTLYGAFSATDGDLVIAAQVDDAWKRLATLIGEQLNRPDLPADTRFHHAAGRNEHRLEILAVVREWVGGQTVVQCLEALEVIDVPCAKIQNIDEVLADPQIQARNMLVEQNHPVVGKVQLANLPFRFSEYHTDPQRPAPLLGQHNREIAASLGYSSEQIEALIKQGVLFNEAAVDELFGDDLDDEAEAAVEEVRKDRYGLVGNPLSHTKSPLIHMTFAGESRQSLQYEALETAVDAFTSTVDEFRQQGGLGLNVTAPFKVEAFEYATDLSERARIAGAVNALKFEGDRVYADNFDGVGLVNDIQQNLGVNLKGKKILVLGAGGAARGAIQPILEQNPALLLIANRTLAKAEAIKTSFVDDDRLQVCTLEELSDDCFDVVLNATSASLKQEMPAGIQIVNFSTHGLAYELAYGKGLTPFLALAKEAGVGQMADGVGMLIEQAAEAFFWWRGVRPDTASVISALTIPLR